jgi:hypothetical protein
MRICSVENCSNAVFGTDKNTGDGFCKFHQYKRTDLKRRSAMNNQPVFNTPSQFTELALFRMIWASSDKKSFITGVWLRDYLNTPLWANCFMHVLPKGQNKYPHFKFYAKNIVLGSPLEHTLWDAGTEDARINYSLEVEESSGGKNTANWQKLKDLEVELLKEYRLYFPTTRGLVIGVKYNIWEEQKIVGHLNKVYFDSIKKGT